MNTMQFLPNYRGDNPSMTMDELKAQYARQTAEYDKLIQEALRTKKVDDVKRMNVALAATLERMIEVTTRARNQSSDLRGERDTLIATLRRIQADYNGLLRDTDTLETLRRIREYETVKADKSIYSYLIIFLVGCLVLLLVMVLRSQTTSTAAPMPSSAAAIAPFT